MNKQNEDNKRLLDEWAKDVFRFCKVNMGMRPSEPIDSLRGRAIRYKDDLGREQTTILFNKDGSLVYHDLRFYTKDMFKNQDAGFINYRGKRFTWQQTVILEAYQRALNTFWEDSFDETKRWITSVSGNGIGKTSTMSVIAQHFLICFFRSQIAMTANTEKQVNDVFMKEVGVWMRKMPGALVDNLDKSSDHIRVKGMDDWFLRAQVARPENPEALAGLHGEFILILVDETSGVENKVFEMMKGALTGKKFVVMYFGNGTRAEGEFYDSHKPGALFTKLTFNSEESPIVEKGFCERWLAESDGNKNADMYRVHVSGKFPSTTEMDDKGWFPLFSNLTILFEQGLGQVINHGVIGVDPAGTGKDRSIIAIRDNIYLKEVLNEQTSNEKDLARKIETVRDAYNCTSNDIGIEAFGIGAKVVANVQTKLNESVTAVLTDKPREEVKDKFHTYKSELAWKFREWVAKGGIIITNNIQAWVKELEKIKYKRDKQGRIMLMDKVTFKKEYGFSPDKFDAACMTFFKDEPEMPVHLTKAQLETKETQEWLNKAQEAQTKPKEPDYSCM